MDVFKKGTTLVIRYDATSREATDEAYAFALAALATGDYVAIEFEWR